MASVREFPRPRNLKELRRIIGLTSYYQKFIQGFAKLAQPLHHITKKDVEFRWSSECQVSFECLEQKLCSAPVLAFPNFERDYVLETDASIQGIAAVLAQQQEDGKLHPVAYASRALNPAEKNYAITELETLAVVWAVTHFHSYLYGHEVTIYTDHSAVKAVLETPNPTGKHARWWTRIYGLGLKKLNILYRPGRENADALSRAPVDSTVSVASITSAEDETISTLLDLEPNHHHSVNSFVAEQRKDPWIESMVFYLEDGQLPED